LGEECYGGKVAGADLGMTLANSFTAISNWNGAELARRSTELMMAGGADYILGFAGYRRVG
jgi:hypothetical protein